MDGKKIRKKIKLNKLALFLLNFSAGNKKEKWKGRGRGRGMKNVIQFYYFQVSIEKGNI